MDRMCCSENFVGVLLFLVLGIFASTASGDDHIRLDALKSVPRARIQTRDVYDADELNIAVRRLIRREAIKHNHYNYLKETHMSLMRKRRGWIDDDLGNRATQFPTTTTTTTTPPPPPLSTQPDTDTSTTTVTTTTTPTTVTTANTTTPVVTVVTVPSTSQISVTYQANVTESPSDSTTQSMATTLLINVYVYVFVAMVTVFVF